MKILISGYYGFGNFGDEALLSGLLSGLRAQGHDITVLSQDPKSTRGLHKVAAAHRLTGLLPALRRTDALISGGGGLLQDTTSRRSLQYYLGVIRLARMLRKKVVVYGQSIGPLSTHGRRAVAGALATLPVSVRDKTSQALLAELGIASQLAADAALLLPPPAPQPQWGPILFVPRGGYPELTPKLTEVATRLHEGGLELAAMAVQEEEDGPELDKLQCAVPALKRWRATSPPEALERMAAASYVISARLHGLVLASLAGKGVSGIVYDPKVAAFLTDLGAPAQQQPPDPERLYDEAIRRPPLDQQRLEALVRRAQGGLEWLEVALQG